MNAFYNANWNDLNTDADRRVGKDEGTVAKELQGLKRFIEHRTGF